MMKTHKAKAQILVVILLVLSILSIFVLAMVSNARKDTQEKRDNKRYEQFYAIGETKLVEAQNSIKTLQLNELQSVMATLGYRELPSATINTEWGATTQYQFLSEPELFSEYESGSKDSIQTTLYFTDQPVLELYQLPSDSTIRLTVTKSGVNYMGAINLYWNSPNAQTVNWEITLDYYSATTTPRYGSFKISTLDRTQPSIRPGIITAAVPAAPQQVGNITYTNGISFSMNNIISAAAGANAITVLDLRIKAIIGSPNTKVSFGIVPSTPSAFPSQFRRITAVVNSVVSTITSADSPTPILNMEYPLTLPSNPLLDYVYRGGYWEQIEPAP